MAGLGKFCSHVGAIMWYLYLTAVHNKRNRTGLDSCTSNTNGWLPPSASEVPYATLRETNFKDCKRKFFETDFSQNNENKPPPPKYPKHQASKPTKEEKDSFFENIAKTGQDIAILRLIPPYNDKCISIKSKIKRVLFNKFYDKKYNDANNYKYHEQIQESVKKYISLKITDEDVNLIEKHTRDQAKSNLWFEARAGVITASKFRQACHSDVSHSQAAQHSFFNKFKGFKGHFCLISKGFKGFHPRFSRVSSYK